MAGKVQFVMDADTAKVVQNFDKLQGKLRDMEQKFGDLKRKSRETGAAAADAGEKGSGAFSKFGSDLGRTVIGLVSVGTAIAGATKLLAEFNAERERGASMAKESFGGIQSLAQISGGDPREFRSLLRLSSDISTSSGIPLNEAMSGVFAGRSLKLSTEELQQMTPVAGVANYAAVVRGVGKFMDAMGRGETGSPMALVNKAGVAAESSDVGLNEFLGEAISLAAPFSAIGGRDEEALAALSVMSGPGGKEPSEAATKLVALAMAGFKSGDPRVRGVGFVEMMQNLKSMPEDERRKILGGRKEALSGYELLMGKRNLLPLVGEMVNRLDYEEQVATGTPTSYVGGVQSVLESLGLSRQVLSTRRTDATSALSEMARYGEGRLSFDEAIKRARTAVGESDLPGWEKFQLRANLLTFEGLEKLGLADTEDVVEYMGKGRVGFQSRQPETSKPGRRLHFGQIPGTGIDITQSPDLPSVDRMLGDAAAELRAGAEANRRTAEGVADLLKPGPNKHTE